MTAVPQEEDGSTNKSEGPSNDLIYVFIHFDQNQSSTNDIPSNDLQKLHNSTSYSKIEYTFLTSENFEELNHQLININSDVTAQLKDFVDRLDADMHEYIFNKNSKFVFVTDNSWNLRVKFISLAHELAIQLPNYLEYPRYFDLKREFMLEKNANNLKNLDAISLKSMLNAKQEEKSQDTDEIQESSIDLMIKIAKQLLSINNNNIFKTPHDLNLDLSHFFIEKSRVLYLTDLPSDTTQSELESWFTQFNCRPIAFWCIKAPPILNFSTSTPNIVSTSSSDTIKTSSNLSSESPNSLSCSPSPPLPPTPSHSAQMSLNTTCSGFAIFSAHEDAIDALILNGKSLQNKQIEIQPSSIKVLDKAQEILIPFPSSKNKPRPGDWNCPSCGFSNFQRRVACFRCSFPAASAAAVQNSNYSSDNQSNSTLNSSSGNSMNNSNNNYNYYQNSNNSNNMSNNNKLNNGPMSNRSNSTVPFRAGDWKCINNTCSYHNFAKNVSCLKCGAPRVQSAILNGHPHHNQFDYNSRSNSLPPNQYKYYNGHTNGNNQHGNSMAKYSNNDSSNNNDIYSGLDLKSTSRTASYINNSSLPSTPTFQGIDFDLAARIGGLNVNGSQNNSFNNGFNLNYGFDN